jgi:hypothetical protein
VAWTGSGSCGGLYTGNVAARRALLLAGVVGASVAAIATFARCDSSPAEFAKIPVSLRFGPSQPCPSAPDPSLEPPSAIPYPTPAGEQFEPGITGVPVPPGAVQVDSFETDRAPGFEFGTKAVQVFDVSMPPSQVLAFYDSAMDAAGWSYRGGVSGPAGNECLFASSWAVDNHPRYWIAISLAYIPREGERAGPTQPLPGFRGKATPFAPALPGGTRFWLVTPK